MPFNHSQKSTFCIGNSPAGSDGDGHAYVVATAAVAVDYPSHITHGFSIKPDRRLDTCDIFRSGIAGMIETWAHTAYQK